MDEIAGRSPYAREIVTGAVLAIALAALVVVSLTVGTYDITPGDVLAIIQARMLGGSLPEGSQADIVLLGIRLPRVLLAAMAGAALAVSGAAYQGLFKNPMVSPDILGVSSGAGSGAALALLLGLPSLAVHGTSFAFGIASVAVVCGIARLFAGRGNTLVVMILAGTIISSAFSALTSLLKYVADPDDALPQITYWLMGSFARSGNETNVLVMAAALIVAGGALFALRWRVNVMAFGEEEARSMGVNVRLIRLIIILAATLLTSMTVCMCGTIGWVGLIVPHIMRLVTGPNYRSLIPLSLLGGACFMLLADDVARVIIPGELPVGILTALIGAPLFLVMLARGRREWL